MSDKKKQQKTIWLSTTARIRLDELIRELGENASQLIVRLINEEYQKTRKNHADD